MQVSKITAILEQENWTAVDAPDEFQAIVDRFTEFDTSSNGFPTAAVTVFRTDASEQAVNQLPEAVTVEAPASDESARALEADKVDSAVKDKVIIVLCLVFGLPLVLITYKGRSAVVRTFFKDILVLVFAQFTSSK